MQALTCRTFAGGTGLSTTDATSYATISITPTTGWTTILVSLAHRAAGSIPDPTATQTSLTFTRRAAIAAPGGAVKLSVFTAPSVASPSAGTCTVDFGATTLDSHTYFVFEVDSDVADILAQAAVTGTVTAGTTYNLALGSAAASLGNALLVLMGNDINSGALRCEQGYLVPNSSTAPAVNVPARDAAGFTLSFGFRADTSDTTATVTQSSANGCGIILELVNPRAIQAGAYALSGTVLDTDGVTPVSGATVRVIDRTYGDSKTATTNGSGVWSLSVNSNAADRYAAYVEYESGGNHYSDVAYFELQAA